MCGIARTVRKKEEILLVSSKEMAFWKTLFGEKVEVWVVMYVPEDEGDDFIGLARTEEGAKKLIRENRKEYYRKSADYSWWKQEIEL